MAQKGKEAGSSTVDGVVPSAVTPVVPLEEANGATGAAGGRRENLLTLINFRELFFFLFLSGVPFSTLPGFFQAV